MFNFIPFLLKGPILSVVQELDDQNAQGGKGKETGKGN